MDWRVRQNESFVVGQALVVCEAMVHRLAETFRGQREVEAFPLIYA